MNLHYLTIDLSQFHRAFLNYWKESIPTRAHGVVLKVGAANLINLVQYLSCTITIINNNNNSFL